MENDLNLLTQANFEMEVADSRVVFVLMGKPVEASSTIPDKIQPLIDEFQYVFPKELSDRLPPLQDIHLIDLISGKNRVHYKINPNAYRLKLPDLIHTLTILVLNIFHHIWEIILMLNPSSFQI